MRSEKASMQLIMQSLDVAWLDIVSVELKYLYSIGSGFWRQGTPPISESLARPPFPASTTPPEHRGCSDHQNPLPPSNPTI